MRTITFRMRHAFASGCMFHIANQIELSWVCNAEQFDGIENEINLFAPRPSFISFYLFILYFNRVFTAASTRLNLMAIIPF